MKKKYARIYNTPEYRKRYTGIYGSWYSMKQRCRNPKNSSYKNYGERGITYDKTWEFFSNFKRDMEDGYEKGLTLDRIDNDGNYCKENCRWVTRKDQNRNKRNTVIISYCNQTDSLFGWADRLGIPYKLLKHRYYNNWSTERMLETPKLTYWNRRKNYEKDLHNNLYQ